MASIGKATLNVVPNFDGLSQSVQNAFRNVNVSNIGVNAGTNYSSGMASGIAKSGAIAGAVAAVTQKALSALSSSLSSAISRFDTLNSYPRVMESLGYETNTVNDSLTLMDERLQGLPTSLSDMVSTVQGLSVCTGDLDQATQAGLALNDMLLASGSSTQITSAAMEQFRQMLSKGKPDMQDWKSLMQAMPGQMTQLAHEMLGAEASATDLYSALGGGGEEATISMDELLNAMIRLDTEGGEGCSSFAEQAKSATGGVSTSMANLQTAVTRGLANTMEAIGQSNISGVFADLKGLIDDAFKGLNSAVEEAMPTVKGLYSFIKSNGSTIAAAAAAFVSLNVAITAAFKIKNLVTAITPASAAIMGLTTAISVVTAIYSKWKTNTENAEKATTGLNTAIKRATSLGSFSGTLDNIAESASDSKANMDDLNASIAEHVDAINDANKEAETQISTLNTAEGIINDSIGQTDLSSEAQGRLTWALEKVNEQFGLQLDKEDVINGFYKDQEGNVKDLKEEIYKLIDAKKQEIKMDALQTSYEETQAAQQEAGEEYAKAYTGYQEYYNQKYGEYHSDYNFSDEERERASRKAKEAADEWLQGFRDKLDSTTSDLRDIESAIYDTEVATSDAADEIDQWGNTFEENFTGAYYILKDKMGEDGLANLKDDLRDLGVTTEELANITPDQMEIIASSYDETKESIVKACQDSGISIESLNSIVLEDKSATITVDGSQAIDAIDTVRAKLEELGWDTASGVKGYIYANYGGTGNAAGGIRLNAAGGYRFHANGAIATKAVPLDIVGEDGAEAIVPLTNKRYSLPFAKTIAEQMGNAGDVTNTYIINGLSYLPDSSIAQAVDNVFTQVMRTQRMGV